MSENLLKSIESAFFSTISRANAAFPKCLVSSNFGAREKVFVPFYTTKRQGSGVGLSLVRQIAAVHNGSVVIGDAKGGGAMITLRF